MLFTISLFYFIIIIYIVGMQKLSPFASFVMRCLTVNVD